MVKRQNMKNKSSEKNKSKIWKGDDGIIYVEITGSLDEHIVEELIKEIEEFLKEMPGEGRVLLDIQTPSIIRSSEFRRGVVEWIKQVAKDPGFAKAAVFANNIVIKTIASFILVPSGVKSIKVFTTKPEALKWLKQP